MLHDNLNLDEISIKWATEPGPFLIYRLCLDLSILDKRTASYFLCEIWYTSGFIISILYPNNWITLLERLDGSFPCLVRCVRFPFGSNCCSACSMSLWYMVFNLFLFIDFAKWIFTVICFGSSCFWIAHMPALHVCLLVLISLDCMYVPAITHY